MKTLILVRHAKSSWDYPQLSDFDRPLNGRGKRDAPRMGRYLAERDIHADLIVSSPANRAITTARTIQEYLVSPMPRIAEEPSLYHASAATILRVVQAQPDDVNSLMIFGHNPGFTDCANQLSGSYIENIPTCGVVGIEFDVNSWPVVEFGTGHQLYFHFPKGI
ncbi:MAG: histidine phosphatase family protein [Cyclobacteriaceae bacterium]